MGGAIFFNSSSSNSLNSSFGIGISAINAARLTLHTIGHNIANVNTEGYSRQEILLATKQPQFSPLGQLGRGVQVLRVQAVRDQFIEAQLSIEGQESGRLNALESLFNRLESIYNPVNSVGLTDVTDNLFGSFQDLAGNPESSAQRESTLTQGSILANTSNHVITQLKGIKSSINRQIETSISQINVILEEIASLNVKMAGSERVGITAEDARDARNLKFRELNEYMNVQGYEDENGALTIITANGSPLVVADQHATLSSHPNSQDTTALDVWSDFSGVPKNITKVITGGSLGGLIDTRDKIIEEAMSNQRLFAAILSDSVNIEHRQGTDLNGNQGGNFFDSIFNVRDNSSAADIDSITMVGDNASFEINYDVTANATSGVVVTDINLDTANLDQITKHDYKIEFAGAAGDYQVINKNTNRVVMTGNLPAAGGTVTFDGISVDFNGQPTTGDTYDIDFKGREGMTGDVYKIEWTSASDYEIYNVSDKDILPIATGTLAGNGMIFFDGLAVEVSGARNAGDFFVIDYAQMSLDPNITANSLAASGSAPGLPEPGDNQNALRMAMLGQKSLGGMGRRSFNAWQGSEIASVGNRVASNILMKMSQDSFMKSLKIQRDSVSGVSLDEEAADLIRFQQAFTAATRYISQVNELTDFLIAVLGK